MSGLQIPRQPIIFSRIGIVPTQETVFIPQLPQLYLSRRFLLPLPFSSLSLPSEVFVAAAGVNDEEEDGEDAEGHDGAEEDYAAGVRAVCVLSVAVGGAVGR